MGISRSSSVSREMLVRAQYSLFPQALQLRSGHLRHQLRITPEGSPADHLIFRIAEDVRIRSKVYIKSQFSQIAPYLFSHHIGLFRITGSAHLTHITDGRHIKIPAAADPRHRSAFFIHTGKSRQADALHAVGLDIGEHFLNLRSRLQILLHINKTAYRHLPHGIPGGLSRCRNTSGAGKTFRKHNKHLGNFLFQGHVP